MKGLTPGHPHMCGCNSCTLRRQNRVIQMQAKYGPPEPKIKPPWAPYPCVRNGVLVSPDYVD